MGLEISTPHPEKVYDDFNKQINTEKAHIVQRHVLN